MNFFLIFLIFWCIFKINGQVNKITSYDHLLQLSLYDGESIHGFLTVCKYGNEYDDVDDDDFESYYNKFVEPGEFQPIYQKRCRVLELGCHKEQNKADQKEYLRTRFQQLRSAQNIVSQGRGILHNQADFWPLVIISSIAVVCGIYLIVVGHFRFKTIYDKYQQDSAYGTPCWQYVRLKYIAAKVLGRVKHKTIFVPTDAAPVKKEKQKHQMKSNILTSQKEEDSKEVLVKIDKKKEIKPRSNLYTYQKKHKPDPKFMKRK